MRFDERVERGAVALGRGGEPPAVDYIAFCVGFSIGQVRSPTSL
jgi:hypothetical protein